MHIVNLPLKRPQYFSPAPPPVSTGASSINTCALKLWTLCVPSVDASKSLYWHCKIALLTLQNCLSSPSLPPPPPLSLSLSLSVFLSLSLPVALSLLKFASIELGTIARLALRSKIKINNNNIASCTLCIIRHDQFSSGCSPLQLDAGL